MGRSPINSEIDGLKKGPWTPEEDQKLIDYIQKHGRGSWQLLPKKAGLNRCGKSCRLRWTNYLRPDIKRGNFSPEEEQTIIDLHSALGNKWSMIATRLPGRTDNEIKNFWNTHLRKKLLRSGIDPNTHQLITDFSFLVNLPPVLPTSNLSNLMNPLENLAKIRLLRNILQVVNSNPLPSFLGGSEILNQFDGPFDGIVNPLQVPSTVPNMENVNLSSNCQPVSDTFRTIPEVPHGKNSGTISSTSNTNTEYWLPGLVPATPEISSGNQVDSVNYSVQIQNYDQLFTSKNYDTWGTAVDDEASGSFWKDIFDESFLASSL
ncbi:hypothetical protein Pfo_010052 [Paulownia fortunei]|nr:hypothetical protein Pfo_010052 [Paulownia fortunei]